VEGKNTLNVLVVDNQGLPITEDAGGVYNLNAEYQFDYQSDVSTTILDDEEPTTDELAESSPLPDLKVKLDKITAVRILQNKTYVKMYKVTVKISNEGTAKAVGKILLTYKGPLQKKSVDQPAANIYKTTAQYQKTINQAGLDSEKTLSYSFYVSKAYVGKYYLIKINPQNTIVELDDENNDLLVQIK
jgi:hypothetical protein